MTGAAHSGVASAADAPPPPPGRIQSWEPWDRLAGGGPVVGSCGLLAGPPGAGKSTLTLHIAGAAAENGTRALVGSCEERRGRLQGRAAALGQRSPALGLFGLADGDDDADEPVRRILRAADAWGACLLVYDSIQGDGSVSPAVLRATMRRLKAWATGDRAVVVLGHYTSGNDIAGPRSLEHMVAWVAVLEADEQTGIRRLTIRKNRDGPAPVSEWFRMGPSGLLRAPPPKGTTQ